jgi:hypothetical protein
LSCSEVLVAKGAYDPQPLGEKQVMTAITRNPVRSHDLRLPEVTEKLKLGDHLLVDEIASWLYAKMLNIIDPEIRPIISDWEVFDEKLKWVLHVQIELLGGLYDCEEIISKLVVAEENNVHSLLKDLIYKYFFLSQDFSSLYYDLGYSTWNLLYSLDTDHYFGLREIPSTLLEQSNSILYATPAAPSGPVKDFCKKLIEGGLDRRSAEAAEISLAEWLRWTQRYKQIIISFYEAGDMVETLYAFHYTMSAAIHLLSISLSMNLLLKPISNHIQHMLSR